MKKIVVFLMLSGLFFTAFSQVSSADLLKKREKEIRATNKENVNPELKQAAIAAIDSFYMPLVREAIKNESTSGTKISEEKNLLGETRLSYNGNQGNVSSRNSSVIKSAEAYSTMAYADANLIISKKIAESISTTNTFDNDYYNLGFEGAIHNRYRYQIVDIEITGKNYRKTIPVKPNETVFLNLLPGKYIISAKGERDSNPGIIEIDVEPGIKDFRSDNGKDYVWGANVGVSR